ncbi:hypothetical protein C6P40_004098 [Pichia californica]|uniref:peptide chain release factor N(5)-glutamine methyltransferase n=1 Tax=Pichia californica TaxID=460514 RepID=A0A9P7BGF5_9ASCO|nr:hypothetical protein C6P42_004630 [[Candida] californica]KAG0689986.1 hypothetical protein C6P40_004098 [[Candida] californica]
MSSKLSQMIKIISKSYSLQQAKQEAVWISQELPESKWFDACEKRSNLVPLQYILGNQPFGKLDIKCEEGVLIPRLDTEEWVLEATNLLKNINIDNLIDYCTGSGCIGLGFASELNNLKNLDCIDFNDNAINLSIKNLNHNKIFFKKTNINIYKGNLLKGFLPSINENSISLLLSNPPYIPKNDLNKNNVEESVLKFEPKEALLGDIEFYDALCTKILQKNNSFKGFIFELGYIHQAEIVNKLLNNNQSWKIGIRNDQSGNLRNVIGWKVDSEFTILEKMVHTCF